MKTKNALVIAFVLIASASAYSQPRMSEERRAEARERYQAYLDKLGLTEEQKTKVDEVNKEYFQTLATARKSEDSRPEKFNTLKQARSAREDKMKEILTKDQYAIYTAEQQQRREHFKGRRRGKH